MQKLGPYWPGNLVRELQISALPLFSKSSPPISRSALQLITGCGLSSLSACIPRELWRSWQYILLLSLLSILWSPSLLAHLHLSAPNTKKHILPENPNGYIWQPSHCPKNQKRQQQQKKKIKKRKTHPTKTILAISTQNYNHLKFRCLDNSIKTHSITARTMCPTTPVYYSRPSEVQQT